MTTTADYNYMFGSQDPFEATPDDLNNLARFIVGQTNFPVPPVENFEIVNEKSLSVESFTDAVPEPTPGLPAGFTYFGQFMDHDISFDSRSDREVHSELPFDLSKVLSENQHSPVFNLETIYGANPVNEKGGISDDVLPFLRSDGLPLMNIGRTRKRAFPFDLPRPNPPQAGVADQRSDGNLLLAQMHLLFLKLHNASVIRLKDVCASRDELFVRARIATIRCYQHLIINEYLPALCDSGILTEIRNSGNLIFVPKNIESAFVPYEFSSAVFRFGHSMIRAFYHLNNMNNKPKKALIGNIQQQTGKARFGGTPAEALSLDWAVDWRLFFFDELGQSSNPANRIDTQLVIELSPLLPWHKFKDPRSFSIAALDLFRGMEKRLASGQDLAKAAKNSYPSVQILGPELVGSVFTDSRVSRDPAAFGSLKELFCDRTPLWFYVLAEAETVGESVNGAYTKLGPLASVIICETIFGLMRLSPFSVLDLPFGKSKDDMTVFESEEIRFVDVLELIKVVNSQFQKELYPDIESSFDDLYPASN